MVSAAERGDACQSDLVALLERIREGNGRKVVFLVGAPMSVKDGAGVPDARAMTQRIAKLLPELSRDPNVDVTDGYQRAFGALLRVRGPDAARRLLRDTVLDAYERDKPEHPDDDELRQIEADEVGWNVPRGTRALGRLIAEFPERFHDLVLTTNFDPLIAIALRLAHCPVTQTLLQVDGNPSQTLVKGCHVVHLHGYWYGRDALHTAPQLRQERPKLKAFVKDVIKAHTLVVAAYGGWDDLFTKAIEEVSIEQNADPDILWTFHSRADHDQQHKKYIRELVRETHDQGRVHFFSGINCHEFFPRLLDDLRQPRNAGGSTRRFPPSLRPKRDTQMRSGIVHDIHWTWVRGSEGVSFGPPRQVNWYATGRSVVIDDAEPRVDGASYEGKAPQHVCLFGARTGGRHLALLFEASARSDAIPSAPDPDHGSALRTQVEVPWRPDSEDSLFTCTVQPAGAPVRRGVALWLKSPGSVGFRAEPQNTNPKSAATNPHLTRTLAVQGMWLKMSAAGGIFVVKLHNDFKLTEHMIDAPRETWGGRWALADDQLALLFDGWQLETHSADPLPPRQLNEWGIFAATERQLYSLERTPFLVAHVLPPRSFGVSEAAPSA